MPVSVDDDDATQGNHRSGAPRDASVVAVHGPRRERRYLSQFGRRQVRHAHPLAGGQGAQDSKRRPAR